MIKICKCDPNNPEKSCDKCRGGRPAKYDDIDLKQVGILAKEGWTNKAMMDFFGVVNSTWYKWKHDHPEFSEILSGWRETATENVERSLYERAIGYWHPEDKIFKPAGEEPTIIPTIKHYPPDTKAIELWLRSYKPEVYNVPNLSELTGKDGGPIKTESTNINIEDLSDEAIKELSDKIVKGRDK